MQDGAQIMLQLIHYQESKGLCTEGPSGGCDEFKTLSLAADFITFFYNAKTQHRC